MSCRVLFSIALVVPWFYGCGDDDAAVVDAGGGTDAGAGTDAGGGTDAGSVGDAGPAFDAGVLACGAEPRVRAGGRIVSFSALDTGIRGAMLTADLCPSVTIVTDAEGSFTLDVTRDTPFNGKVTATGFLPASAGEESLHADFAAGSTFMFPTVLSSLLPHWSTTAPTIVAIAVRGDRPPLADGGLPDGGVADPCDAIDAITYSVVGHPEAVVTYYSGTTAPSPDSSLTATGPLGAAEISGLTATAPGAYVMLAATKAGCGTVSFVAYPFTGRFALENGVLTYAIAYMTPFATPTP